MLFSLNVGFVFRDGFSMYSINQKKKIRKVELKKSYKSPIKSPSVPRVSYLGTVFNAFP